MTGLGNKDTVILVKSDNILIHTTKCIEDGQVRYHKSEDYDDYYTESEVEEVTNPEFYYDINGSHRVRHFNSINDMIHTFNMHNEYKDKTGITNLRINHDQITDAS